ncbi:MAG: 3' terminal RNA ribose 2'-O-methyltransferase Hen1 [Helicobacteraceae bacterium]|jgi:3' terminal RNA ribose 2'-O-methyltransferase Hen1|nr:3' terminal RNA ribose 2'-O-methyltransferase Hen1 [Helicobacteraceae bacterium]
MLLTITYEGENAREIGFLFRKNPSRPQVFEFSRYKAFAFYPEADDRKTTIALLLEIDPIDLAKSKSATGESLFDYVNDRPYVSSSFMSVAIAQVFGTAMSGVSKDYQALADAKLRLSAQIVMMPCKGGEAALKRVFEPLGYTIALDTRLLDDRFASWGTSRYANLTISGEVRLCDLLRHLYVLIPVFDGKKHYWVGKDETEKLLRHGKEWLANHPEKEFIARRYLAHKQSLSRAALKSMETPSDDEDDEAGENAADRTNRNEASLNKLRLNAVVAALKERGAKSAIDVGCGEGAALSLLLKEPSLTKIAACDVDSTALQRAKAKVKYDRLNEAQKQKISFFQGSLTYKDSRFSGYDALCAIEVIEHLEPSRIEAFTRSVFEFARPKCAIVTTPNREYNAKYQNLPSDGLRHNDHRFEWTRKEFRAWANDAAARYGYAAQFSEIGEADEKLGAPTQMALFSRSATTNAAALEAKSEIGGEL